jgi:uncharacterized protein YoxC
VGGTRVFDGRDVATRRSRFVAQMTQHGSKMVGAAAVVALSVPLVGCGKPSYCSKVDDLKSSVAQIKNVNPVSTGSNSIVHTVNQIEKNINSVVSSAKSDFPNETRALSSSYSALKGTVTQVSGGQTSRSTLTTLAAQAVTFANAVDDFRSATKSKCS